MQDRQVAERASALRPLAVSLHSPAQCGFQMSRCANTVHEGTRTHTHTHILRSHRNTRWGGLASDKHITVFSCYEMNQQSLLCPHQVLLKTNKLSASGFLNTVPAFYIYYLPYMVNT